MKRKALYLAAIVLASLPLLAQDKPLGDVARESRAGKSATSHAAKVITNEDFAGAAAQPVKSTDDPFTVVKRAEISLLRDTQHVCRSESAGNSGPGWSKSQIIEVSGPDRKHIVGTEDNSPSRRYEYVVVDKRIYLKSGTGVWQPAENAGWSPQKVAGMLESAGIPDELKFGYSPDQLKLMRSETLGGSPVFLYQSIIHTVEIDRTISIWVGANDGLLRRSEMTTRTTDQPPSSWRTSTNCSYGTAPAIEPPL